jgi:glutamate-1-semialdehyde 2,1-aminomutase
MRTMGQRLRDGLARQAAAHGFRIRCSGPPQMPMLLFDDDADAALGSAFCSLALQRGVYLHPKHNMFLSVAHRAQDIDRTLDVTEGAFAELAAGRR